MPYSERPLLVYLVLIQTPHVSCLSLQPPLLMQASGSGTPQKAPGPSETETYSGSAGPPAGDKPEGCLLSKDQTVQACTQLQQVSTVRMVIYKNPICEPQ